MNLKEKSLRNKIALIMFNVSIDSGEIGEGALRKLDEIISAIQSHHKARQLSEEEIATELHSAGLSAFQYPRNRSGYDWDEYRKKLARAIFKAQEEKDK